MSPTTVEQLAGRLTLSPIERERLRAVIAHAASTLPTNWPIGTFISRNPLAGFEHLPFEQAIRSAATLSGGRGTLTTSEFRRAYREGRITEPHISEALQRRLDRIPGPHVLGSGHRELGVTTVLQIHLVHGLEGTDRHRLHWSISRERAMSRIRSDVPAATQRQLQNLGRQLLTQDLDRLGTEGILADFLSCLVGPGTSERIQAIVSTASRGAGAMKTPPLDRLVRDLGLPGDLASRYLPTLVSRLTQLVRRDRLAQEPVPAALVGLWLKTERAMVEEVARTLFHTKGRVEAVHAWLLAHPQERYLRGLWSSVQAVTRRSDALSRPAPVGTGERPSTRTEAHDKGTAPPELTVGELLHQLTGTDVPNEVNRQIIKWSAALLDAGQAGWRPPIHAGEFFDAWKDLAACDAIPGFLEPGDLSRAIRALPTHPEEAVAWGLHRLGIPEPEWPGYLSRHLWSLPGWAGYIKCHESFGVAPSQRPIKVELIAYLAVRLVYEVLLGEAVARRELHVPCTRAALQRCVHQRAADPAADQAHAPTQSEDSPYEHRLCRDGWRLFHLAQFLAWSPDDIDSLTSHDVTVLRGWLDACPAEAQGTVWLEAYEAPYRVHLLNRLASSLQATRAQGTGSTVPPTAACRPEAQAIFCIDVRSETFRRHLEAQGLIETFGYAGFFGIPLAHTALDAPEPRALCPVLIKPKFVVRELPESERDRAAQDHAAGVRWLQLARGLFHDLKGHPLSSYMLIDCLAPLFGAALALKTIASRWFGDLQSWVHHQLVPPAPTRIPTRKPTKEEAEAMVARAERARLASALVSLLPQPLQDHPAFRSLIEELCEIARQALLAPSASPTHAVAGPTAREMGVTDGEVGRLIAELREKVQLNPGTHRAQLTHLAGFGLALPEQAQVVEAGLRLIGLTRTFAPLVLVCGHGSTTDNNPYAAGYDCGACGGNPGDANARVFAALANAPDVRRTLAARGIAIPDDTYFLAGKHDTTLDRVRLYELDEVPRSLHPAIDRLTVSLDRAGAAAAVERCGRLPGIPTGAAPEQALRHVQQRSTDWAQVRPEWGLSGNAAFIIGPRFLSRGIDLQGRVFLHSYDPAQDPSGKALETIMTAPLVVGEWINLQYYFSAVDPWTYGSGSKVYHNVVGGIGVMLGSGSDLQGGLPLQSVSLGTRPFHEPVRLLAIIHASVDRITTIIEHHAILKRFFDHEWVQLISLDHITSQWSRYRPGGQWEPVAIGLGNPDEVPTR